VPTTLFQPRAERVTVLYDGDCTFCRWSVGQLASLNRERRLEFVPYQHAQAHPERPDLARADREQDLAGEIHVVRPDGSVHGAGEAMFEIIDALPGGWLLRPWMMLPGARFVADFGYDLVADRRGWLGDLIPYEAHGEPRCDLPHHGSANAGTEAG
jgi:predicted DCC family thiol-disulfide oxidoreductase YuxK